MATLMKFELGSDVLEFEAGAEYPARRPVELYQIKDRTAAGTLQIEKLGITIRSRVLTFTLMPIEDYDKLINWFVNIVNGGQKSFIFTDERGAEGEVKITDDIIDFPEVDFEIFSGTLTLEYI